MRKFNLKNIIIAVLISSMLFSLVACVGGNDPEDTSEGSDADGAYIDIVKDGQSIGVVYSATASSADVAIAKDVADIINRTSNVTVECTYEKKYDANKAEIVIGDTSYPESKETKETLGYGESTIRVVGKKIVIIGYDSTSLENAIKEFIKYISLNADKNKNIKLSATYNENYAPNKLIAELPVMKGWTPVIEDTGDDCYELMFGANQENTYRNYLKVLVNDGYSVYTSNTIEGNEYTTYVKDNIVVTAIFTKANNLGKILVEWITTSSLPIKEADNKYTAVDGLKSSITQIGLFYDVKYDEKNVMLNNFNGMSYAIRLADGSFIIVDGGHGDIQADHLYDVLTKQAPDSNNIVIAAWFFSHDHGDHTGAFDDFASQYGRKVTVERFIYNFTKDSGEGKSVRGIINMYFPNALFTKAHPGQVFHIRNAEITMLYTIDLYEGELTDTNNASIVWKMELEGKSFMCLGDYSEQGATLMKLYTSKTLKSDIVQLAHHGISGQSKTIYEKITPEYAFWPVGAKYVSFYSNGNNPQIQLDTDSRNSYFHVGNFDQSKIYWALDDTVVMTLDNGNVSVTTYGDHDNFMSNYKK